MAAQLQRQIKVLRIGILQDGKIVQEQRMSPGETVTIGGSSKATFTYDIEGLPKRFPLFVCKQGQYSLRFLKSMSGKVAFEKGIASLGKLIEHKKAEKRGDAWVIGIKDKNRGKITIGNITVLFQFVTAPPEPLHPGTPLDFRPKLFDEDDPVFLGFLGLFTLLASIFMVYSLSTEPVELVSAEEIPDRFVEVAIAPPDSDRDEKDLEDELNKEGEGPAVEKKEEKAKEAGSEAKEKKEEGPKTEEDRKAAEIRRKQQMQEEVMEKSLLLRMIGTRGESASNHVVEDLFAEDDGVGQDLHAALQEVGGVEIGTSESLSVKEGMGAGTGREDASISDLAKADGGEAGVGSGPATKVKGTVASGNADVMGGDPAKVKDVISRYFGQVVACYEQRLKDNPSLGGRVEVSWTISRGRVTTASVFANTTGDDALARCIVGKVRRWRFPSDLEPIDVVFPFILAPG